MFKQCVSKYMCILFSQLRMHTSLYDKRGDFNSNIWNLTSRRSYIPTL